MRWNALSGAFDRSMRRTLFVFGSNVNRIGPLKWFDAR